MREKEAANFGLIRIYVVEGICFSDGRLTPKGITSQSPLVAFKEVFTRKVTRFVPQGPVLLAILGTKGLLL